MVWRSVVVSQPAKLKREHFSLVVEQEQAARVPFEDIAVIVLNNREITLTHPVLSACAEYGIGLFATGANHQLRSPSDRGRCSTLMAGGVPADRGQHSIPWRAPFQRMAGTIPF